MKTISLNYNQLQNSLYLLKGCPAEIWVEAGENRKVVGVFNFEESTEGIRLRISRIAKIIIAELDAYTSRSGEIKTSIFSEKELTPLKKEEYTEEENLPYQLYVEDFYKTLNQSEKGIEFNSKVKELYETPIEITFEPFLLSKIENHVNEDKIDYSFVYENFSE